MAERDVGRVCEFCGRRQCVAYGLTYACVRRMDALVEAKAREDRQRRMARIRSNAGGAHKDTRRESRAEVKIELKREKHGYGR